MKIKKRKISSKNLPFIVAEMSGNHNKSLNRALKIVESAAKAGANAIKIQTYKPETITVNSNRKEFKIKDNKSLWKGQKLYDLYKKNFTPWEWHEKIFNKAKKLGIICFSSPFDETAVDFLESINCPLYKIASFEINHIPLIEKIAKTKKPVILSTGLAKLSEITLAVKVLKKNGCRNFALLKCSSTYPSTPDNSNLMTINVLRNKFKCEVGLSDHTLGIGTAVASVALGASIIEKHFTLNKKDGGSDSKFSLEPNDFKLLVNESIQAWKSIGKVKFGPTNDEKKSLKFKRSIYFVSNLKKGDKIKKKDLKIIRPNLGLDPKYFNLIIGKKIKHKVSINSPVLKKNIDFKF